MAQIYNSDLSKELIQGASIQVNRDLVPSQLAEKVVPVMEVNPKMLRIINVAESANLLNATSATIITLDSNKDFYLCGASLALYKDVTATTTSVYINAILANGKSFAFLKFRGITLTIQDYVNSVDLNTPILLKRGSIISIASATNVGNITAEGGIWGYYVENQIQ